MIVRRFALPALALASACNDGRLVASGSTDAPPGVTPDAAASTDASPDAPASSGVARLIAPLSTATVTQQQPTLRWTGSPTAPTVDLCLDRACTMPLAIAVDIAADHNSGKVSAPLPAGWIYWRVHSGSDVTPTWQFLVGKLSATTAVDASSGTVLDANGDGFADVLVGGGQMGAAYLYLGNPTGIETRRIDLVPPDNNVGFGAIASKLGDVNGDGFADFWVEPGGHLYLGGPFADASAWNGAGAANRIDAFPASSPVPIGDVNGDGYADVYFESSWQAFVWFGSATLDPANKIMIARPTTTGQNWGSQGGAAGDVNGDGYADFLIGAYPGESDVTISYAHLYLGSASPSAADWDADVTPHRIDIPGEDSNAAFGGYYGYRISPAGDMNGDGYSDFAVGAMYTGSDTVAYSGKVHLYFGSPAPAIATWSGATAPQRVDLIGPGYFFQIGYALSPAGDVNGDGYPDLVVGGIYDLTLDQYGVGELYLGSPAPGDAVWNGAAAPNRVDLTSGDGVNGYYAYTVAGGGDTDGDGYADFIVSATGAAPTGLAHFFRGKAAPSGSDYNGTAPPMRVDLTSPTTVGKFGIVR